MTAYKLKHCGDLNFKTMEYETKWEFVVNGDVVYPDDDCQVGYVSLEHDPEVVTISLSCIPERIDISGESYHHCIWIWGKSGVKTFPTPYRSGGNEPSETIFNRYAVTTA